MEPNTPYLKKKLYRRIQNLLSTQAAFSDVHHRPSRTRPQVLCATVDPAIFIGFSYPVSRARLELEFDLRWDWDHYRIQWIESERELACGWHQDMTHPELGNCHFQIDVPDGSVERTQATFLDDHPLAVVTTRLKALPEKLATITANHDFE